MNGGDGGDGGDGGETRRYLDRESVGDNAVDCVLCKRVEVFVRPSHELGLQPVSAAAVVLIHEEIQLCGKVWNRQRKQAKLV